MRINYTPIYTLIIRLMQINYTSTHIHISHTPIYIRLCNKTRAYYAAYMVLESTLSINRYFTRTARSQRIK